MVRHSGTASTEETEILFDIPAAETKHISVDSNQNGTLYGKVFVSDQHTGENLIPEINVMCEPLVNGSPCQTMITNPSDHNAVIKVMLSSSTDAQAYSLHIQDATMTEVGSPIIHTATVTHNDKNATEHPIYTLAHTFFTGSSADNIRFSLTPK